MRLHAHVGTREKRAQDAREPRAPAIGSRLVADEILPDLDQQIREPVLRGVPVDRIACKRAVIGLVVAHHQIGLPPQGFDAGNREAGIGVPENADMPGTRNAFPHGREAVIGDDRRNDSGRLEPGERGRDRPVIRLIEPAQPPLRFVGVGARVAWHDRAVRQPHHQRGIVATAVGVNQQARKARQKRRRAELARHRPRHCSRPDVIGDMPLKFAGGHPQIAIFGRHRI